MADRSKIEWTDASWNPIRARNLETGKVGWFCSHASPGCELCYAESFNNRLGTGVAFKAQNRAKVEIFLDEEMLRQPLRWKKPRKIFVCSMTDLFGEFVSDDVIDRVFAVMALSPQHTFQVVTKRASRMREWFAERWQGTAELRLGDGTVIPAGPETGRESAVEAAAEEIAGEVGLSNPKRKELWTDSGKCRALQFTWPLPNVWLGVSVEDQRRANERVPHLLRTPAAVRFVSAEPLLEAVNFDRIERAPSRY